MTHEPEFHAGFAAALLDPNRPPPACLVAGQRRPLSRRFAVYRNNVVVSLIDALAARFPVCRRIVGVEFFRDVARLFVRKHPPTSPLLSVYGDAFPEFVAGFPPAASVPYLADVARLEAARTRAYHAADAKPLGPGDFSELDLGRIGELRLVLHPSLELVRSRWAVATIWERNTVDEEPGPTDVARAENVLVARPALEVELRRIPPCTAVFVEALMRGGRLVKAAARAADADAAFNVSDTIAELMVSGLIVGARAA